MNFSIYSFENATFGVILDITMSRYFLYLAYNGANYCGWQIQPNGVTVQSVLEEALATLLQTETRIAGAGRTDSGVHARMMVANFDTLDKIDTEHLCYKLNKLMPRDIVVHDIVEVKEDAHARFNAISRTYRYYITTQRDPFLYPLQYYIITPLDIPLMNECCDLLLQYEDFSCFSKLHTVVKSNICDITFAQWTEKGDEYIFTISANRFLRNMVRAIVGTMLDIGKHKISIEDFKNIIESKDRGKAGSSAPGHALFLEDIVYPIELFL